VLKGGDFISTTRKLFRLAKKDTFLFVSMLVTSAVAAFVYMTMPMITRIVVDNIINDVPFEAGWLLSQIVELFGGIEGISSNLWLAGVMLLSVSLVQVFFVFLRGRIAALVGENTVKRLKDKLYDHLQRLPYEYHVKAQTGDLIQRCTSDVEVIRVFFQNQMVEMARAVFLVASAMFIMFQVDVRMSISAILFLPFVTLFSIVFFRYVKRIFKETDEREGELTTVLQECVSGIRVTRAFGRGHYEMERFIKKNGEFRDITYELIHKLAKYWSLSDLLSHAQALIVLVYGVYLTYHGEITVGDFILFNSYVNMMIWPLAGLGRVLSDTGRAQVATTRIYEILETPIETDTLGAVDHDLGGDIVFDNVSFQYDNDKKVFDGLSFTINKGETIAILGATGAGKSTLMHILLRLYDYQEGSITINGKELRMISKDSLRKKIGMVLQEPFLYAKTIKNNLHMAKDDANMSEIVEAAKVASVHHVIEDFEKGYDTLVGEKGVTLSGGQKQRVAIARTLIRDSEILIFDDSLSAVDTETDIAIREELSKRNKGTTTFIVSQRIATLMDADRIFVIEKGRLSDSGTHDELINRDGLYSRIWKIQSMLEEDLDREIEEAYLGK